MTEDTVDLSKGKTLDGDSIENPKSDTKKALGDTKPVGQPIENYDERGIGDTLEAMHHAAVMAAANAKADDVLIGVRPIVEDEQFGVKIRDFSITYDKTYSGYEIYQIGSEIYYRPIEEFKEILHHVGKKLPGWSIKNLTRSFRDPSQSLVSYNVKNREDCLFIVSSIISSLTGKSYSTPGSRINDALEENLIIRKHNKLSTDGDISKSVAAKEAKYGTKSENDFKQEIEDEQKKANVVGCLDQQPQQEGVIVAKTAEADNDINEGEPQPDEKPVKERQGKLPNKNMPSGIVIESLQKALNEVRGQRLPKDEGEWKNWDGDNVFWEPGDYVIVRNAENGVDDKGKLALVWYEYPGQVTYVHEPHTDNQQVVVLIQGHTVLVEPKNIRPDSSYAHGALGHHTDAYFRDGMPVPLDSFEINPETHLSDKVNNDDYQQKRNMKTPDDYRDMNQDRYLYGNVVVRGDRITFAPVMFNLTDISESKKEIRFINESEGVEDTIPIENVEIEYDQWPWGIVISEESEETGEDEPVRKIKVDPVSYVNADEESEGQDGMVDVLINGELTKMMKKYIKILV